jgi:hypothetical protein
VLNRLCLLSLHLAMRKEREIEDKKRGLTRDAKGKRVGGWEDTRSQGVPPKREVALHELKLRRHTDVVYETDVNP